MAEPLAPVSFCTVNSFSQQTFTGHLIDKGLCERCQGMGLREQRYKSESPSGSQQGDGEMELDLWKLEGRIEWNWTSREGAVLK